MWIHNSHYMPATEDMKVDAVHLLLQTAQHIADTTENNTVVNQLKKLNEDMNFHQLSVPDLELEKNSKFKQSEAVSSLTSSVMINIKKAYTDVLIDEILKNPPTNKE